MADLIVAFVEVSSMRFGFMKVFKSFQNLFKHVKKPFSFAYALFIQKPTFASSLCSRIERQTVQKKASTSGNARKMVFYFLITSHI